MKPSVLGFVAVATLAHGQDVQSRMRTVRESLPPIGADVRESLVVAHPEGADSLGTESWGRRNGQREFQMALSAGRVYVHSPNMADASGAAPKISCTKIFTGDHTDTILGSFGQGTIDVPFEPHLFMLPTFLIGYMDLEGHWFDSIKGTTAQRGDGYLLTADFHDGRIKACVDPAHGWQAGSIELRGSDDRLSADWRVASWAEIAGHELPAVVVQREYDGDSSVRWTSTSTISYWNAVDDKLFSPVWPEGGHIKDNVKNVFYLVKNGKLAYDDSWTKASNRRSWVPGAAFTASACSAILIGVWHLRGRRRS